jgi:hypothetical protein
MIVLSEGTPQISASANTRANEYQEIIVLGTRTIKLRLHYSHFNYLVAEKGLLTTAIAIFCSKRTGKKATEC